MYGLCAVPYHKQPVDTAITLLLLTPRIGFAVDCIRSDLNSLYASAKYGDVKSDRSGVKSGAYD